MREATCYIAWKTGVELKLYEFQLAQSNQGIKIPFKSEPLPTVQQDLGHMLPDKNAWCSKLPFKSEPLPAIQQELGDIMPNANAWRELDIDMTSGNSNPTNMGAANHALKPTLVTRPPIANIQQTKTPTTFSVHPSPSKAQLFPRSRPGRQLEAMNLAMQAVASRVRSYLQSKATTSTA